MTLKLQHSGPHLAADFAELATCFGRLSTTFLHNDDIALDRLMTQAGADLFDLAQQHLIDRFEPPTWIFEKPLTSRTHRDAQGRENEITFPVWSNYWWRAVEWLAARTDRKYTLPSTTLKIDASALSSGYDLIFEIVPLRADRSGLSELEQRHYYQAMARTSAAACNFLATLSRAEPLSANNSEVMTSVANSNEQWSNPMSLKELGGCVRLNVRKFKGYAKQFGLREAANRQSWQIRLDGMAPHTRAKFE